MSRSSIPVALIPLAMISRHLTFKSKTGVRLATRTSLGIHTRTMQQQFEAHGWRAALVNYYRQLALGLSIRAQQNHISVLVGEGIC